MPACSIGIPYAYGYTAVPGHHTRSLVVLTNRSSIALEYIVFGLREGISYVPLIFLLFF